MPSPPLRPMRRAASLVTAGIWLDQGLRRKVLGRDPAHRAVVGSVPGPIGAHAGGATLAIGAAETALAAVVATRGHRRSVALLQTGVLAACNAGGLLLGRRHIPHPARMVARNTAFLALIWGAVDGRQAR